MKTPETSARHRSTAARVPEPRGFSDVWAEEEPSSGINAAALIEDESPVSTVAPGYTELATADFPDDVSAALDVAEGRVPPKPNRLSEPAPPSIAMPEISSASSDLVERFASQARFEPLSSAGEHRPFVAPLEDPNLPAVVPHGDLGAPDDVAQTKEIPVPLNAKFLLEVDREGSGRRSPSELPVSAAPFTHETAQGAAARAASGWAQVGAFPDSALRNPRSGSSAPSNGSFGPSASGSFAAARTGSPTNGARSASGASGAPAPNGRSPSAPAAPQATPSSIPAPRATPSSIPAPQATPSSIRAPQATPSSIPAPRATPSSIPAPRATPSSIPAPQATPSSIPAPQATPSGTVSVMPAAQVGLESSAARPAHRTFRAPAQERDRRPAGPDTSSSPPATAAVAPSSPGPAAVSPAAESTGAEAGGRPRAYQSIAPDADPVDNVHILKAERLFDQALKDKEEGNLVSARMNMKLAVTFNPSNELYATAYEELSRDPAAKPRSISTVRSQARDLYDKATEAERHGDIDRAVELLEKAIERSRRAPFLNRLGVILAMKKRQYIRAQALIEEAIELVPTNTTYERNLQKILSMAASVEVGANTGGGSGKKGGGLFGGLLGRRK